MINRTCEACSAEFAQRSKVGRPRRFCEACRPPSRAPKPVPPVQLRSCEQCGVSAKRKFCSLRCRDLARRVPCSGCAQPIYLGTGSLPPGEAKCRQCRLSGCGTAGSYRRGCRCPQCRRANVERTSAYWEGRSRRWIPEAERLAIYERDAWVCQLCDEPVDPQAHFLSGEAPSLDHIEPVSLALIPNHDPSNLRTAHRSCNSSRGNRVA